MQTKMKMLKLQGLEFGRWTGQIGCFDHIGKFCIGL
jgi:hypothetical protein